MLTQTNQTDEPEPVDNATEEAQEGTAPEVGYLGVPQVRLQQITNFACDRLQQIRSERGQNFGNPVAIPGSFIWNRQRFRLEYEGDQSVRSAFYGAQSVFSENNWTRNKPAQFIRFLAAKHADDLVGSNPFFAAMPENNSKPELSKQVENKVQEEVTNSNLRGCFAESIRVALTEGERPIKITWEEDVTTFIGDAVVMVGQPQPQTDPATGQPILDETGQPTRKPGGPVLTPSGDYIYPKDDTIIIALDPNGNPIQPIRAMTEEEIDAATQAGQSMQVRLKKEPTFIFTLEPVYSLVKNLPQKIVHRQGVRASGMFAEDFVYPLHVPSLDDPQCDIMAQCYDESLDNVKARFKDSPYAAVVEPQLQATGALAQESMPDIPQGEWWTRQTSTRPLINIHETYIRIRVNPEDEFESWVFLVLDFQRRLPIYAEYLGNMKMKRPPFILLRGLESVPGRAYGNGIYHRFYDKHLAIDLWFNRVALKSSKDGSATFIHNGAIEELKMGQKMVFGGTQQYHISSTKSEEFNKDHPPVFRVYFNEMSEMEFKLMAQLIQDGELEFGIVTGGDGNSEEAGSSLLNQGTATGVRNVERAGNTLQRSTEEMMADDLEKAMELAVDCILENIDTDEMAFVPGSEELANLNREEIRQLDRDVRILMTRARGDEAIMVNQQAIDKILQYYSLTPSMRVNVRQQFIAILKQLDVQDADDKIKEPSPEELQAEQQGQQQPTSERTNISVKLTDLAPSERGQALAQVGITAAPPQELAVMQAQEAAVKTSNVVAMPPQEAAK